MRGMWVDAMRLDLSPRQSQRHAWILGQWAGNKQADFGLCFRVQEFSRRLAPMLLMRRDLTTGCVPSAAGLDL